MCWAACLYILHFSAKFADDLSGSVYKHIIAHRGTLHTQMSASGPATGTGKSLFQTIMMYIFFGEIKPSTTSLTEASFYAKMEEGDIFGKLKNNIVRIHEPLRTCSG